MAEDTAVENQAAVSEMAEYDFPIPKNLIAQNPLPNRSDARLMLVDRAKNQIDHLHVRDLPEVLRPQDCLILNDTRVVPAKLVGYRQQTHGRWQGLFLEADANGVWKLMCKTRGKIEAGETVMLLDRNGQEAFSLRMVTRLDDGQWAAIPNLQALDDDSPYLTPLPAGTEQWSQLLQSVGRIPLPHYIRGGNMVDQDLKNYQTVYAKQPGAVAAPTAGLHFTQDLLLRIKSQGVAIGRITLHVGAGTFRPVQSEKLSEHKMHSEWCSVEEKVVGQVEETKRQGGRVITVGTTSIRSIESASREGKLKPFMGETDLFIRPGFQFHTTDALMTNFHLPRTTLLVLVRTFGGDALMRRAYQEAIDLEYRFFSYGDAMLIV